MTVGCVDPPPGGWKVEDSQLLKIHRHSGPLISFHMRTSRRLRRVDDRIAPVGVAPTRTPQLRLRAPRALAALLALGLLLLYSAALYPADAREAALSSTTASPAEVSQKPAALSPPPPLLGTAPSPSSPPPPPPPSSPPPPLPVPLPPPLSPPPPFLPRALCDQGPRASSQLAACAGFPGLPATCSPGDVFTRWHVTTQELLFLHLRALWADDRPRVMVDLGSHAGHGVGRNVSDAMLWLNLFHAPGSLVLAVDAFEDYACVPPPQNAPPHHRPSPLPRLCVKHHPALLQSAHALTTLARTSPSRPASTCPGPCSQARPAASLRRPSAIFSDDLCHKALNPRGPRHGQPCRHVAMPAARGALQPPLASPQPERAFHDLG